MKYHALAALAALGIALSGCATIIKGTTQSVSIDTDPVEGARCTLTSSEGEWFITTPGSVVVHKTKNDLKVVCSKEGYQDAEVTIESKFNGATAGNLLLGGVIGVGIDAASGANYQYAPKTHVTMYKIGETPPDPDAPPPPPAATEPPPAATEPPPAATEAPKPTS
jgi:hypothetical protein